MEIKNEKIEKLIKKKIIQYLKYKNYSSAKLKEKLLLLKYKYPHKEIYQKINENDIDKILKFFQDINLINDEEFLKEQCELMLKQAKSLKKIKDYLIYKALFPKNLVEKHCKISPEKEFQNNKDKILKKIYLKIEQYQEKNFNKYQIINKIKEYLYRQAYSEYTINKIIEIIKKEAF